MSSVYKERSVSTQGEGVAWRGVAWRSGAAKDLGARFYGT